MTDGHNEPMEHEPADTPAGPPEHLAGLAGIEVLKPRAGVVYLHLLFDRHELVLSEGCWTESLYPGEQALRSMPRAQRREILSLFPELPAHDGPVMRPARHFAGGAAARRLADRHQRNARALLC